jgi:hypothetical protein
VDAATSENPPKKPKSTKNPAAVSLGKLGGLKGGKARAEKLTPEQRTELLRDELRDLCSQVNRIRENYDKILN